MGEEILPIAKERTSSLYLLIKGQRFYLSIKEETVSALPLPVLFYPFDNGEDHIALTQFDRETREKYVSMVPIRYWESVCTFTFRYRGKSFGFYHLDIEDAVSTLDRSKIKGEPCPFSALDKGENVYAFILRYKGETYPFLTPRHLGVSL